MIELSEDWMSLKFPSAVADKAAKLEGSVGLAPYGFAFCCATGVVPINPNVLDGSTPTDKLPVTVIVVPSKVKLASPCRALAPVTVEMVLLVLPESVTPPPVPLEAAVILPF